MIDLNSKRDNKEAIELLYRGYRAFTDQADRLLEKRGLNRAHHRILYFVGRSPDGSVAELLDALAISKQALNVPLRQLISMELISSKRSGTDARVKMLRLTSSGKTLESRLTQAQATLLDGVFKQSGPVAEQAWHDVMHILVQVHEVS